MLPGHETVVTRECKVVIYKGAEVLYDSAHTYFLVGAPASRDRKVGFCLVNKVGYTRKIGGKTAVTSEQATNNQAHILV